MVVQRVFSVFCLSVSLVLTGSAQAEDNTADNCSAVVNGNNNTTNIVCNGVVIQPGFSREDFLAELRRRETQIREEEREFRELLRENLEQKNQIAALDFQNKISVLEEQLEQVNDDLSNIDQAYLDKLGTISDRLNGLLQIKAKVSTEEFELAFEALLAGDDQRAFELFERVNDSAKDAILIAARATFQQGKILDDRYDYLGAAEKYERAAQLAPQNLEYARESANFASIVGNYEVAVNDYRRIINIVETNPDEIDANEKASIFTDAAIVYYTSGDVFLARIYFQQALGLIETNSLQNMEAEGKCLACLALIMMDLEDFGPAKDYLDRALEVAEQNGDVVQIADVTSKLGSWEFHQERFPQAIQKYEEAIFMLRDAGKGEHPDIATKLHNLGFIYDTTGDPCTASSYINEALDVLKAAVGDGHPDYLVMSENQKSLDLSKCG